MRERGLSGTWLPKAQTEDLGRRTGRRLSKEASEEWAQAIPICLRDENPDYATVLVLAVVQPFLEAHNICDDVRQSDFLSLEEKFLPVCAGLAHCKDFGVATCFFLLEWDLLKVFRATHSSFPSLGYVVQGAARRN